MGSSTSSSKDILHITQQHNDDDNDSEEYDDNSDASKQEITNSASFFNDDEIVLFYADQQCKPATVRYKIIEHQLINNTISSAEEICSSVYKCLLERVNMSKRRKTVIVKKMLITTNNESMKTHTEELLKDALHAKYILKLLNCFEIQQFQQTFLFIVSEYHCEKSLQQIRSNGSMKEEELTISTCLQLIFQIVMALKYLNSKNFVNNFITMENILVRRFENGKLTVLLGDFNLKHESINGDSNHQQVYFKSDVWWSFGVTLLRFIFFNVPQTSTQIDKLTTTSHQEEINQFIDEMFCKLEEKDAVWTSLKRIVSGMLQIDSEKRFGIDEILMEIFVDIQNLSNGSTTTLESNYTKMRDGFKMHPSVIDTFLSQDGLFLQYLTDSQRDNKDLVIKAIEQNAWAYEFASERLQNDSQVIIHTLLKEDSSHSGPVVKHLLVREVTQDEMEQFRKLQHSPSSAVYKLQVQNRQISEQERNDTQFMSNLLEKDGKLLELASPTLRNNDDLVKKSVQLNGLALQFASEPLRKRIDLVEMAIDQNPLALAFLDASFKQDIDIVRKAVYQNGLALEFASKTALNRELIKIAIHQNFKAFRFVPPELIGQDPEFICSLLSHHGGEALEEYEKHFLELFDIVDWIIAKCSGLSISKLKYQSADLLVMYTILCELDILIVERKFSLACLKEAAKKKHPYALFKLGSIYYHGDMTIEPNYALSFKHFEESSKLGFVQAQMLLFTSYAKGDEMVKSADLKKAFNYATMAANQGNSLAQYNLSRMYKNGEGVIADSTISFKWLIKSGRNGNSDAQLLLSLLYDESSMVKDDILSFEWCLLAADQDNSFAQLFLGEKLISGDGCTRNIPLATKWLKKAAQDGNVSAMLNLGLIYNDSSEMKNHEKAFKWFKRAAEKENAEAQHNLGFYYYEGLGVKKDYYEAFSWFVKAHNSGYKNSFHNLMILIQKNLVSPHDKMVSSWIVSEAVKGREEAMALLEDYNPTMFSLIKQGAYGNVVNY